MAARASAVYILSRPDLRMIAVEMDSAAPVCMRTPDNTPADRMRSMAGVMSFTPSVMAAIQAVRSMPPARPPAMAPAIRLYAAGTRLLISRIAMPRPISAPIADIMILICLVDV